jgi:hypothetical protein
MERAVHDLRPPPSHPGERAVPAERCRVSSILPDTPRFETAVYGTVFAERAAAVQRLHEGDALILVPDPPGIDDATEAVDVPAVRVAVEPKVWVHAQGGDVLGHLSPDINRWLVPRMLAGARYTAAVVRIGDPAKESWRRLVVALQKSES